AQLEELAQNMSEQYGINVTVIVADLADPEAPLDIYKELANKNIQIDALINNAGYGVPGYYVNTDWQQQKDFIQVLVTAVSHLCHLFLPAMVERGYGRIINVSSINGLLLCSPGQSLYASAKTFVVSLSHTLQAEAGHAGVNVSALCPGLTYTEFHDVTGTRDMVSKVPKSQWLDAQSVANQAYEAVMRGDLVCTPGRAASLTALLPRFLPRKLMINLMKRQSLKIRKVDT
ncbi:MAG: SDR family NAD(P)-dependent oxidoreductase, partial [Pseudomonadales bacterium]|nr:SDR family NAD(P)-dependent oxidoreductase [Pseudomonadales bacterium]